MTAIRPFAEEGSSLEIGRLTVENRSDRVTLYGDLDLTRDRAGLANARRLKGILDAVVKALTAEPELPERLPPAEGVDEASNPFALP